MPKSSKMPAPLAYKPFAAAAAAPKPKEVKDMTREEIMALLAPSQGARAGVDASTDQANVDALPSEGLEAEAQRRSALDPTSAWITLRLAKRALHVGDPRGALEWLSRGLATPVKDHPALPSLRALEARLAARAA